MRIKTRVVKLGTPYHMAAYFSCWGCTEHSADVSDADIEEMISSVCFIQLFDNFCSL